MFFTLKNCIVLVILRLLLSWLQHMALGVHLAAYNTCVCITAVGILHIPFHPSLPPLHTLKSRREKSWQPKLVAQPSREEFDFSLRDSGHWIGSGPSVSALLPHPPTLYVYVSPSSAPPFCPNALQMPPNHT